VIVRANPGVRRHGGALRAAYLVSALLVPLAVSSCSWEQAYYATQTWQRNECSRLPDGNERERCMNRNSASYGTYRQQADESKPK
jgi:hypothetical protein